MKQGVDKRGMLSYEAYTRQVLGDMANSRNLIVINDEAQHSWRINVEAKGKYLRQRDMKDNIFGRSGPFHFVEDGENRYIWSQVLLTGKESSLGGRPDLIVTNDSKSPTAETLISITECKSHKSIGAQVIRAEFGKAYDLKVT